MTVIGDEKKSKKSEKNTEKTGSIDFSKDIFARYHSKMRDEIEFSEADFYEDNIYDEPEYRHSPHFTEYDGSRREIRP